MAPPPGKSWAHDLLPRIASAVVLVVIAAWALYWSVWSFDALVAAAAAVLAWEWAKLCGEERFGAVGLLLGVGILAMVLAAAFGAPGVALALLPISIGTVYVAARRVALPRAGWSAFGPLYVGAPCVAIVWLRGDDSGALGQVVWLMVCVWATDIGAYFAGRLIGGPKLAPRISPNKTWAGLGGAVAGAVAVGLAARLTVLEAPPSAATVALASGALALLAQSGDLFESWIKRRFGVKDTSGLIPGHGGLFDRVDGLLAAAFGFAAWQWLTEGSVLSWR